MTDTPGVLVTHPTFYLTYFHAALWQQARPPADYLTFFAHLRSPDWDGSCQTLAVAPQGGRLSFSRKQYYYTPAGIGPWVAVGSRTLNVGAMHPRAFKGLDFLVWTTKRT